ncbi:MAG: galactokinase family protein [Clostridiales bacterium]|nr:galactokinase family protein [Clostridiales bacterium]
MADILKEYQRLYSPEFREKICRIYSINVDNSTQTKDADTQLHRYEQLLKRMTESFGEELSDFTGSISYFSSPGRTEVGGNHTDHNGGRVLAAAVDLDAIAAAVPVQGGVIEVRSEGFPTDVVGISNLKPIADEKFKSSALIRGICARMKELGYNIGGFKACTSSNVLKGSGLSSSAAFEVLMVTILNHFYNDDIIDPITCAKIAQYAENEFFGKPCGLMDQTACAVGGFITIDFKDFSAPLVKKVEFDFIVSGHALVITDTGGNHADLHEDYASIATEMKQAAQAMNAKVLREVQSSSFIAKISDLRHTISDRAILRALHFFEDNHRVVLQVEALQRGDFGQFLKLVDESGRSSWMLCQNCYTCKNPSEQGVTVALAASRLALSGEGASRVHGGGFAGTIQAFVPVVILNDYLRKMKKIFGQNACFSLKIRQNGAICI